MSDDDFLYLKFGDIAFPTGAVQNAQLFSVLDPARDKLLAFFKAAINQELAHSTTIVKGGSPWAIATAGTTLSSAMPVQDVCYLQPTSDLVKEASWGMPLLCCYRTAAVHEEFTLYREVIKTTWGVDYILPPLPADDRRKVAAVLPGVRALLTLLIRRRAHPAYQNGTLQFGQGYGGFDVMRVMSSSEGPVAFSDREGSNFYYAVHLDIETTELDDTTQTFTDFEGVDLSVGVGGSGGILPDAVQARTDTNPDPNYGKVPT